MNQTIFKWSMAQTPYYTVVNRLTADLHVILNHSLFSVSVCFHHIVDFFDSSLTKTLSILTDNTAINGFVVVQYVIHA